MRPLQVRKRKELKKKKAAQLEGKGISLNSDRNKYMAQLGQPNTKL
jgi:hypothetical protein